MLWKLFLLNILPKNSTTVLFVSSLVPFCGQRASADITRFTACMRHLNLKIDLTDATGKNWVRRTQTIRAKTVLTRKQIRGKKETKTLLLHLFVPFLFPKQITDSRSLSSCNFPPDFSTTHFADEWKIKKERGAQNSRIFAEKKFRTNCTKQRKCSQKIYLAFFQPQSPNVFSPKFSFFSWLFSITFSAKMPISPTFSSLEPFKWCQNARFFAQRQANHFHILFCFQLWHFYRVPKNTFWRKLTVN